MKTIAIIPARGGSKRLPGKNLMMLGGLPLLAHSIRYALAATDIIDGVFVSTNDPETKKTAIAFGARAIDRPEALSGDLEPTVTALGHVLEVVSDQYPDLENVVLLQPTNPLRPKGLLDECFSRYNQKKASALFTVTRSWDKLGRISGDRFIPFNYEPGQRSQDLEPLYRENGLLYISRVETIRSGKIMGDDALPFAVEHVFASVDIDTLEDFERAEYLIKLNQGKKLP